MHRFRLSKHRRFKVTFCQNWLNISVARECFRLGRGGGSHHNRDQRRVPPNPGFTFLTGFRPLIFHPLVLKKRKHLQRSVVFRRQLRKDSTFEAASNKGLAAIWTAEPMTERYFLLECFPLHLVFLCDPQPLIWGGRLPQWFLALWKVVGAPPPRL